MSHGCITVISCLNYILGRKSRMKPTVCRLIQSLLGAVPVLLLFDWPAYGATFRWASTSNRIYVENGGAATLSDIKAALPNAPLDLVDSVNSYWLLRANLQIADGCTLVLHGTEVGGDVNALLLQSNNSTNAGSFVGIIADWGVIDIQNTSISSWDTAVNGPDTEFETFGRAFIRVRSRLETNGVPLESRMDILNSDISYLGYDASESYGLSWKVIGTHPDPSKNIFDFVKVYGDIRNSRIHHNFWAVYTFGLKGG
jgi:poly(beta-D-mannuronate) C5 epimerase